MNECLGLRCSLRASASSLSSQSPCSGNICQSSSILRYHLGAQPTTLPVSVLTTPGTSTAAHVHRTSLILATASPCLSRLGRATSRKEPHVIPHKHFSPPLRCSARAHLHCCLFCFIPLSLLVRSSASQTEANAKELTLLLRGSICKLSRSIAPPLNHSEPSHTHLQTLLQSPSNWLHGIFDASRWPLTLIDQQCIISHW